MLQQGQKFRIVEVHDLWAKPVVEGALDGKPVQMKMTGDYAPEFGCYVLFRQWSERPAGSTRLYRLLYCAVPTDQLRGIGKRYERLVRGGVGRMLRCPMLWEDAAKTLFTTNCSWAMTEYMAAGICSAAFVAPAPSGRFPFPAPDVFASLSAEKLRRAAPLGYRAPYLRSLARAFVHDPSLGQLEGNGMDWAGAYAAATKLRGFGPYAASHLAVLAGHYDAIPIDSEVVAYARKHLGTANPRRIQKAYRRWGRFAWWGYKMDRMLWRRNWLGD